MEAAIELLVDQLRTGLLQPEELTEPEAAEILSHSPTTIPLEILTRLRMRARTILRK